MICILGALTNIHFIIINTSTSTSTSNDDVKDNYPGCIENDFCTTLQGSLFKVLNLLFRINGDDDDDDLVDDPLEYTTSQKRINTTQLLFVIFAFITTISFLTILFAILNHSFINLEHKGEEVFWRNRLTFVTELQDAMEFLGKTLCFGSCNRTTTTTITKKRMFGPSIMDQNDDSNENAFLDGNFKEFASSPYMESFDDMNYYLKCVTSSTMKPGKFVKGINSMRLLWDILLSSLTTHKTNPQELNKDEMFYGECNNRMFERLLRCSLFSRRLIAVFFIPLWFLGGLVTLGVLWPPQIRELVFCPIVINDHQVGKNNKRYTYVDDTSKDAVQRMDKSVTNLEREVNKMKADIGKMKEEMMSEMTSIKGILLMMNNSPPSSSQTSFTYH